MKDAEGDSISYIYNMYIDTHAMAEGRRIKRINRIVKMLTGATPPVNEVKFVSMCSYNLGVSMKKIREYIKVLEGIGSVTYEDGTLIWHE